LFDWWYSGRVGSFARAQSAIAKCAVPSPASLPVSQRNTLGWFLSRSISATQRSWNASNHSGRLARQLFGQFSCECVSMSISSSSSSPYLSASSYQYGSDS
jgi:hypothetical protein